MNVFSFFCVSAKIYTCLPFFQNEIICTLWLTAAVIVLKDTTSRPAKPVDNPSYNKKT